MISFENLNNNHYNECIKLLEQLTTVGSIEFNDFNKFVLSLSDNHMIKILKYNNEIAGMGTIFIENKIIHNFGKVGHIEDIVIEKKFRGCGFGKIMINHLTEIAKKQNCYKVILDCNDNNVAFYEKCNFVREGNMMTLRFK